MTNGTIGDVLRQLRRLTGTREAPDDVLLQRVAERGDPDAFEALVCRHGGLVVGVCRRQLRDPHDVEDAFQATFLVLLRKASSVRRGDRLAGWLFGVAYRVARQLRQRRRETAPLPELADRDAGCDAERHDLRRVLDEEVQRLPEKYRVPVLMCHLQGTTQEQAARQLGWPPGTVATRVRRGLEQLRDRLVRRGIEVTTPGLVAALTPPASEGALPAALISATVCLTDGAEHGLAAVASLAGQAARPGLSTRVVLGLTVVIAATAFGAGLLAARAWTGRARGNPGPVAFAEPAVWRQMSQLEDPLFRGCVVEVIVFNVDGSLALARNAPVLRLGNPENIGMEFLHLAVQQYNALRNEAWEIPAHGDPSVPVAAIAFSPDGLKGAISREGITLWALSPLSCERSIPAPTGPARHLAFSPDGQVLAAVHGNGRTALYDPRSGVERLSLAGQAPGCRALAFSRSDGGLVTLGEAGEVQRWEVPTGALRSAKALPVDRAGQVALFPEGRWWCGTSSTGRSGVGCPARRPRPRCGSPRTAALWPPDSPTARCCSGTRSRASAWPGCGGTPPA
ncbi:MAG: sigma-70 family RNA polymerase sigma factor [Gemmataceae bacterium]